METGVTETKTAGLKLDSAVVFELIINKVCETRVREDFRLKTPRMPEGAVISRSGTDGRGQEMADGAFHPCT